MKNNTTKKIKLWYDFIWADLVLGLVLPIFVLIISVFAYGMRFPKLSLQKPLILNLAFLISFLPFLVGLIGIYMRTMRNQAGSRICEKISIIAMALGILATILLTVIPPYVSYTENVRQYLETDNIGNDMSTELRRIMPASITSSERVSGATDSGLETRKNHYSYYRYVNMFEDRIHISLTDCLNDESYKAEKERIQSLGLTGDTAADQAENEILEGLGVIDYTSTDGTVWHITMDDKTDTIIYSALNKRR